MNQDSSAHNLLLSLLIIITINLFIIDLKLFASPQVQVSDIATIVSPTVSKPQDGLSCPVGCITMIQSVIPEKIGSPTIGIQPAIESAIPREYYIPLGNGSTTSANWDDLPSTDTVIDPSLYGTIKEVYFVAALGNPTQNGKVDAQLYNVSDKHAVWNSQLSMNGPASQTISSGKITLDTGSKLYRVQLKSGLSYPGTVTGAKIRIISSQ